MLKSSMEAAVSDWFGHAEDSKMFSWGWWLLLCHHCEYLPDYRCQSIVAASALLSHWFRLVVVLAETISWLLQLSRPPWWSESFQCPCTDYVFNSCFYSREEWSKTTTNDDTPWCHVSKTTGILLNNVLADDDALIPCGVKLVLSYFFHKDSYHLASLVRSKSLRIGNGWLHFLWHFLLWDFKGFLPSTEYTGWLTYRMHRTRWWYLWRDDTWGWWTLFHHWWLTWS